MPAQRAGAQSADNQELLERASRHAGSLSERLMNFVCRQETTRFTGRRARGGTAWKKRDVISSSVLIAGNKERYSEVTVNGKRAAAGLAALGGLSSTGEFASLLAALFAPQTQARFTYRGESTLAGAGVAIFDYDVELRNSPWLMEAGTAAAHPAYHGAVWIAAPGAEVLRVEMESARLPARFPLESANITLDYGFFDVAGERVLLPLRSEHAACTRRNCLLNRMEFTGYRRFVSESKVSYSK